MFYATDADWSAYVSLPQQPAAKKTRKPRAKPEGFVSRDELRVMLTAKGVKWTTKHTKAELEAMLISGVTVRAAAQDRENARRRAARAAKA